MKNLIKRVNAYLIITLTAASSMITAYADPTPTPGTGVNIDEQGLKDWIKSIVQPITNIALFVIPLIAVATTLISFAQWFALDDQEKQQRPFSKVLKRNGLALIIAESIPVLLKFIGY